MITFEHVSVRYDGAAAPILRDVQVTIDEGELALVVGATGTGKSTLLGAINGLVPHFTGGHLQGRVVIDGRPTSANPPRELADVVGVVSQDPLSGFVTDVVEEELAYALEQLAVAPDIMRKRVEETLDLLSIAELRARPMRTLSGGQQQRVAIAAALTGHPRVLVLDEPTSALDPTGAEEVLAAITRLVHDLGVTVVIAEHRLERVVQYADLVLHVRGDGSVVTGDPATVLGTSNVAPPVIQLGRLCGWAPLPLSVRDARRQATPLREHLATLAPPTPSGPPAGGTATPVALRARQVVVRYGDVIAVREVNLDLHPGEIVALMGRNGSGKSSLLWALQGTGARAGGSVDVAGTDPGRSTPAAARALVGLVPQTAADLLYLSTVEAECHQADRDAGLAAGSTRAMLDELVPGIAGDQHPRDLSEGQRLSLALVVQLSASPSIVLLDEPTRGLDYGAKDHLARVLQDLAREGRTIVVATHDVEFVASVAERVVVMAEGEVVADGPTTEVVIASPTFAPQVARILYPAPWLTVPQVAAALEQAGATAS